MGFLDSLSQLGKLAGKAGDAATKAKQTADMISSVQNMLNGKFDVKSIATLLAAYLSSRKTSSSEAPMSAAAAATEGQSIAEKIASAVNLNTVKSVTDIISGLQKSDKVGTNDIAAMLQNAAAEFLKKK